MLAACFIESKEQDSVSNVSAMFSRPKMTPGMAVMMRSYLCPKGPVQSHAQPFRHIPKRPEPQAIGLSPVTT